MSIFGATGTPVLDFWWRLLWVSKPEWAALFALRRRTCCFVLVFFVSFLPTTKTLDFVLVMWRNKNKHFSFPIVSLLFLNIADFTRCVFFIGAGLTKLLTDNAWNSYVSTGMTLNNKRNAAQSCKWRGFRPQTGCQGWRLPWIRTCVACRIRSYALRVFKRINNLPG